MGQADLVGDGALRIQIGLTEYRFSYINVVLVVLKQILVRWILKKMTIGEMDFGSIGDRMGDAQPRTPLRP